MGQLDTDKEGPHPTFFDPPCHDHVQYIRSVYSHCGPRIDRTSAAAIAQATDSETHPVSAANLQKYNQCVFLRGFRILDKKAQTRRKLGLKVKGNSGGLQELQEPWFRRTSSSLSECSDTSSVNRGSPATDGGGGGKQHALGSPARYDGHASDIEIVTNDLRARAPVESLLEYILDVRRHSVLVAPRALTSIVWLDLRIPMPRLRLPTTMIWVLS